MIKNKNRGELINLQHKRVEVGKKRTERKKNKTSVYGLPLLRLPNLCMVGARFVGKLINATRSP